MGRSSHEQAQKNRQRIVECAARLFREFGVDNVSVAEVMSAADMTIGGFYKHFESKDALVEEVFSLAFDQSSMIWREVSERKHNDPSLRPAAIVDYYLKKKEANQACPMIAFAPHVTTEAADASSRESYRLPTQPSSSRHFPGQCCCWSKTHKRGRDDEALRRALGGRIGAADKLGQVSRRQ